MVRVSARAGRRVRMERGELRELHYVAPIVNLASIARYGILSHARAARVVPDHESVADASVQGRRAGKQLPSGRALHEYANLYLNARNPMLYRRCHEGRTRDLCVLRIDVRVLDRPGAYVADRNAACDSAGAGRADGDRAERGVRLRLAARRHARPAGRAGEDDGRGVDPGPCAAGPRRGSVCRGQAARGTGRGGVAGVAVHDRSGRVLRLLRMEQ